MITIIGTPKSQSNTGIAASLSLNQFAKPSGAIGVSFDGALKTSKEHNCSESFHVRYAHQAGKLHRCSDVCNDPKRDVYELLGPPAGSEPISSTQHRPSGLNTSWAMPS
jgi:hypothetical protein